MSDHTHESKIAVLLSGGVDSSSALMRLRENGYTNLMAFYLKIWLEDDLSYLGSCPWEEDIAYAEAVAKQADVEFRIVPLQREYFDRVVSYTVEELKAGRTPSPDVMCNSRIKFGAFYDAVGNDFDLVATGHYARTVRRNGTTLLLRAPDPVKDQTYFLSHLTQAQVSRLLFPIGDLVKSDVRKYAKRSMLPNRDRKDSQGICFLGKLKYNDFIRHYLGEKEGMIVERESGKTLGSHRGYWFHTIGQRRGLGLAGGPWYVSGKCPDDNIVYVSGPDAAQAGARRQFTVRDPSWIHEKPGPGRFTVKLRHGPRLTGCTIVHESGGRISVLLDEGDEGIASGQFAVFYSGDICLGCGCIE